MRSILTAGAAIALMAGLALPAQAKWSCNGPEYVCGSAKKSYGKKSYRKASYGKRSASYKAKKTYRTAKKSRRVSKKSRSYSSGSHAMTGKASYYWQPQRVASGGWFNPNAMTAAHKTLPFGTKVRVTNRVNGRSVVVTINDRGPYIKGRIIDLSKAAAKSIRMTGAGVVPVSVSVLGRG